MKMVGTLAELMVKTNPRLYRKYVVLEKGRSILYLQFQKALYGMMKGALGFQINPYNPYIANKMVDGLQMTIRWHVDDLMIGHLKHEEIMQVVQQMKDIYGDNLKKNVGTCNKPWLNAIPYYC
jgi:hypothetical protein